MFSVTSSDRIVECVSARRHRATGMAVWPFATPEEASLGIAVDRVCEEHWPCCDMSTPCSVRLMDDRHVVRIIEFCRLHSFWAHTIGG